MARRRAILEAMVWLVFLLWPALLAAQSTSPVFLGRTIPFLPPALDASGRTVVLASAVDASGTTSDTTDLYAAAADGSGLRRLTKLAGISFPPQGVNAVSVTPDGARAAFTASLSAAGRSTEEVHLIDVAAGADRTLAVDTEGCIQPLCANCFFYCVNSPHVSPDGSKVLYAVRRQDPFRVVNADGTGLTRLPVYSGALAPSPQRVISRSGLVTFSSSAPSGPTFAASATDVYILGLDGAQLRNVTQFGSDTSIFTSNATISADGGTVAFERNRANDATQIWIARTDGTGLRALTSGEPSQAPSISADGSTVAFVRAGQVYTVRSEGTGLKALTAFQLSAAQDPVMSDDGLHVVFSLGPRSGGRGAIYAVDTDGKNLRPVYAPRALNRDGVNGVIGFSSPSPGSLLSAYGLNLASDTMTTASRFPLPDSLAGVSLLVNGRPAPLVAVTPWQVNAQLPPEMREGAVAVQLRFADGFQPTPAAAPVQAVAPAIFSDIAGGSCQAAALHGGTATLADREHPAGPGEALEIYGSGLGPADPFVPAGTAAPSSPLARTLQPEVLIGGRSAEVRFAGLTPGFAGLYQVNAIVPAGLRAGAQSVDWRVGGVSAAGCATIWVK